MSNTYILDIETDGLLPSVTKMWIIGWLHLETGKVSYWLEGDLGWKEELDKATMVVAHNGCGFDFLVLEKLFGYKLPKHVKIRDTLIMSIVFNYKRFESGSHSLEEWGSQLGNPKGEHSDWSAYSEEMLEYWKQDLNLTKDVHAVLLKELQEMHARSPKILTLLKAEYAASRWFAKCEDSGWPFDLDTAVKLLEKMEEEQQVARNKLLPRLGNKTVAVDKKLGVVEPKKPKWLKDGRYDSHTCNWFEIIDWSGLDDDRLVEGPYSRIKFVDLDVNSVSDVKIFLFRNGWEPTEWNTKTVPDPDKPGKTKKIKTSPKITEDSLECMDGDGKLYCDFLTTSSRVGVLKGWINAVDFNGRVHGKGFPIGTPSFRARHSIIVNVPASDSAWGAEMRALFTVEPGWVMIGADSSGNQARGLAHYLKSKEYTHTLLTGDIHAFNARALDVVLQEMGISWDKYLIGQGVHADEKHTLEEALAGAKRKVAKRILYAFLFGASGAKLWSYVFGVFETKKGNKLKNGFTRAVPGFAELMRKLESIYGRTKQSGLGYIPGIAGQRIFCDSFHKLLVYLLQALEKATCSAACMLLMEWLEEANIPYQPLIFYHDELDFMVPEAYSERAMILSKKAFQEGPKLFGVEIMDGEAKSGRNWLDVH
jgi:DNA polymerase-1